MTAGTIFHRTKRPLTVWFLAIYHVSRGKGGIASAELGRRLGVCEATAWLIKHKIRGCSRDASTGSTICTRRAASWRCGRSAGRSRQPQNRVAAEIEQAVLELAPDQPAWGQTRVSNKLRKHGLSISASGVRGVWPRHDRHHMKRRLKALAAKSPRTG